MACKRIMLDSRSLFLVSNWKFRGPRRVDIRDVVDVLDVLEVLDVWDVGDVWDPSYDGAGVRDVLQFSTSTLILFLRKY